MDSATWCRTPAAASAARRLRPEVSKNSSTALSSNEGELARHGADDLYGAQHLAGRHVEGGVEAGGAVAGVIVGPARDLTGAQGQHRLRPVERLHLRLLASTPSRPSADRVEDQRERIVDRGVAVAIVGAKAPVAQRAEDGAQDEERERIARDVAPDLSAGLRELHQRLDQLVRRLGG